MLGYARNPTPPSAEETTRRRDCVYVTLMLHHTLEIGYATLTLYFEKISAQGALRCRVLMEYLFEQVCVSMSPGQSRATLCRSVTGVEFLGSRPRGSHILYRCHLCRLFRYVSCSSAAEAKSFTDIHSYSLLPAPQNNKSGEL